MTQAKRMLASPTETERVEEASTSSQVPSVPLVAQALRTFGHIRTLLSFCVALKQLATPCLCLCYLWENMKILRRWLYFSTAL